MMYLEIRGQRTRIPEEGAEKFKIIDKVQKNVIQHWKFVGPIFQAIKARIERIGRHSASCLTCY